MRGVKVSDGVYCPDFCQVAFCIRFVSAHPWQAGGRSVSGKIPQDRSAKKPQNAIRHESPALDRAFQANNRIIGRMTCTDPELDPMPLPPPDPAVCCGSGCDPCVLDLHDREMERYRQALREWRARHPETTPAVD